VRADDMQRSGHVYSARGSMLHDDASPGDRIDRHQLSERSALKLTDVMAGLGLFTAMWEPQHDPSAR
jgi:hypothetical protein